MLQERASSSVADQRFTFQLHNLSCTYLIIRLLSPAEYRDMETSEITNSATEAIPSLIKYIYDEMDDFGIIVDNQLEPTGSTSFENSPVVVSPSS